MERATEIAAAVESSVETLVAVLERARLAQQPTIPPTQLRVLTIVAGNRHTNMSRLAEALDVVPSSASRLCDRLEATGLLRRIADPRDRREVRLVLTAASRQVLADLQESRRAALGAVLGRMPASAQQDLLRALQAFEAAAQPEKPGRQGRRTA